MPRKPQRPLPPTILNQPVQLSKEYRDRLTEDGLIRRHGFKIHTRSSKGCVLWEKEGKLYTQEEALMYAGLTPAVSGAIK